MSTTKVYSPIQNRPMSVAVLLSGSGRNFEALYRKQTELYKQNIKSAKIDLVFSNVPECRGIITARKLGIKTAVLSSKQFFESLGKPVDDEDSRKLYDLETIKLIEDNSTPDLIVLAGYRRRLSSVFYKNFKNAIINMYPGDTTKDYLIRGVSAAVQGIMNKDTEIRCTAYIDQEGQRFGPAVAQSKPISLEKYSERDIEELNDKISTKAEWITLPFVVFNLISQGRISTDNSNNVYLDKKLLPKTGYRL